MNKLERAEKEFLFETKKGTHTFTMCKCQRFGCRNIKCSLCWKEEIAKLEEKNK